MDKINEYRQFIESARSRLGYWKSYSLIQFTVSLARLMKQEKVSGRKLAARLGLSPAHVSKVLSGNENITIETMAKFADALGGVVHIHVARKGVSVRWEELPADQPGPVPPLPVSGEGEELEARLLAALGQGPEEIGSEEWENLREQVHQAAQKR